MENEKAFKNWINEDVVSKITSEISFVYPKFNANEFKKVSLELKPLELKARTQVITKYLKLYLPNNYLTSLNIISKVLNKKILKGFELWPFSEYISQHGLNDFDESIKVLNELTKLFTSEFAIRPFIIKDHKKVLNYFKKCVKDENHHVRRWVSEGSRPLLPWGQKLNVFIENPELTIKLLDSLKYDEELYVRKSVANHLNDISKFNPKLVIETLKVWQKNVSAKDFEKINWIKRHALRTLIKKGDQAALSLMGISSKLELKTSKIILSKSKFKIGDSLEFKFTLESKSKVKQKIVVDYLMYFLKSNGKKSPKVFKLKTFEIMPKEKIIIKKVHSLRKITTMKFYSGKHAISLQINGQEGEKFFWTLNI
jgi:3-methyladenine DNA glycosylase AlkC